MKNIFAHFFYSVFVWHICINKMLIIPAEKLSLMFVQARKYTLCNTDA